jgi:hypothetical protein
MTNNEMVQMVGYDYMVDVANRAVYNKYGRPVKEQHSITSGRHFKMTNQKGVRHSIGSSRVMYSAMNGINPDDIPISVCVVQDGDVYRLMYRSDMQEVTNRIVCDNRQKRYRTMLEEKAHEIQLLLDYHDTGDRTPVITYCVQQQRKLMAYIIKNFHVGEDKAYDIASESIENICQNLICGKHSIVEIMPTLRGYARSIISKQRKITEYR